MTQNLSKEQVKQNWWSKNSTKEKMNQERERKRERNPEREEERKKGEHLTYASDHLPQLSVTRE